MNVFLASRYIERVRQGAAALQLWDGAHGGRVRDRLDVLVEREDPLSPAWLGAELPHRSVHLHGVLYERQLPGRPKKAIDVRVYDRRWRFTPRRLRLPIPATPEPAVGATPRLRIRRTALYPGPAYDVTSCSTGVRGRVTFAATGRAVRWPRVLVPNPSPPPPGGARRPPLAVAHGDQQGEFLLLLPPHVVIAPTAPAGATTLDINISWQTLPAAAATRDPLEGLPVEVIAPATGTADPLVGSPAEVPDWIAMGWDLPPEYTHSVTRTVAFTAGRIHRDAFAV